MQLEKLENQVRFVQMIIRKELVVSGRKRLDIMNDLKAKGFKAFPKVEKPKDEIEPTDEDEGAEEEEKTPDGGYDYLLNVSFQINVSNLSRWRFTPSQTREWRNYNKHEKTKRTNSTRS
jgi:hypothetical protein